MEFILRNWQDRSIRFKLNCIFVLIILVSILTLSLWGTRTYGSYAEEQADQSTLQMIHQVESSLDMYIKHLNDIIHYANQSPELREFMAVTDGLDHSERLRHVFAAYAEQNAEIAGMMLVNRSGSYVGYHMHRINRDPLTEEDWYRQAVDSSSRSLLIGNKNGQNVATEETNSSNDVLSLVRAVVHPATGETEGVILMDLKLDPVKRMFDSIQLGKTGFIYVVDAAGDVVYAPVNPIVYRIDSAWLTGAQGSLTRVIKGHAYRILYADYASYRWKIVGVVPNSDYSRFMADIGKTTAVIAVVTVMLAILASYIFTGTIIRPIRKLMRLMSRVKQGEMNVHFASAANDEIGQLGHSFNHMVKEINNLIGLVYVEQKKKREAELQLLQAQIKPHFLYNTLDTIQWMAQDYEADDIIEMIGALTNLFRYGLNRGSEWITVRDELIHANSYLVIQMSRYTGKLEYEFQVPEELKMFRVLKLTLQPLIENAIYHGIKPRPGKGKIVVRAEQRGDRLVFLVEDDGIGMPEDRVEEINRMLRGEAPRQAGQGGFGLFNVQERITLTYGNAYGIKVYSLPGLGTTIELSYPLLSFEELREAADRVEAFDRR